MPNSAVLGALQRTAENGVDTGVRGSQDGRQGLFKDRVSRLLPNRNLPLLPLHLSDIEAPVFVSLLEPSRVSALPTV